MTGQGSPETPLLRVSDVAVAYGSTVAVADVSLSVSAGAVVAVVGAPQAGKTSLLRAISGLLAQHGGRVTRGTIALAGEPITGHDPAAVAGRGLAHVLQGRRVFADLTVEENLQAGGFRLGHRRTRRVAVERVLAEFPLLARRRSVQAGYLSGGEQQLLVIARALVASPRLLLLDEPSLGLASVALEAVAAVVTDAARAGTAVLLAEGTAALALATGASTVVLRGGTLVAERPRPDTATA